MMMEETTTHKFYKYNADTDRGGVGHRELQQQQNQNWNVVDQQQQFEQNVQDLFGIGGGQTSSLQANNNNEVAYNFNAAGQYYDYNPFTYANTKDVNTSAFMTAVCLNAMLFVILVGGYELFRRWLPSVYSPKSSGSTTASSRAYSGNSGLTSPTSHTSSATAAVNINTQKPLGWVTGVVRASWSTVRSSGGLDSYMFLRYIRLCFRISFTSALWGMIILWPGKSMLRLISVHKKH